MSKYYRRQSDFLLYKFKNKTFTRFFKSVGSSSSEVQLPEKLITKVFRVIAKNEFGATVKINEIESEDDSKEKSFLYRTWKW